MIPLLDTVIGFATIMLMLSLLVKTLTSLVKNQVNFYTQNLQHEVDRLVKGVLGVGWNQAVARLGAGPDKAWLEGINWERVGDEFLTQKHMQWVLGKLGAPATALTDLEGQVAVHTANLKYAFETRIKNLALAVGLALCLGLNVNALTIWQTLYSDQQLRTTFATTYAQSTLAGTATTPGNRQAKGAPANPSPPAANPNTKTDPATTQAAANDTGSEAAQRQKLNADTQDFMKQLADFQKNVNFGIGRIWTGAPADSTEAAAWAFFLREFLGSLMTAVLISIGAAYWHDLLQTLSSWKN
jgi:hypothetical protein